MTTDTDVEIGATVTVMTTQQVKLAAREAAKRDYNRQLSKEAIKSLDPEGIHIVSFSMIHEHAAGVKVDPHARAMILFKFTDDDTPHQGFMDMDLARFNKLARIRKNKMGAYEAVEA